MCGVVVAVAVFAVGEVFEVVVAAAFAAEVIVVGGAAVFVGFEVVQLGVSGYGAAAGEGAGPVSGAQPEAHSPGDFVA
ncbi:hypothetical protein, partial [Paenarthrobacter sp. Z7-10]|uniref:hypothetical protein n=1 Tax=Paenarthrobacter sp. Z7-10 TaxID=2787635 RepID=UPI0022A9C40E